MRTHEEYDRIEKATDIIREMIDMLPEIYDAEVTDGFKMSHFLTNPGHDEILGTNESEIEALANFFDQLFGMRVVNTGYYDPMEDAENGELDAYSGLYYVSIA